RWRTPLPLGFLALAAATTVVAAQQLRWVPLEEGPVVGLVLLAFVFPTQLLASILGFLARDIAAGTGMGLLAGTWLSVALVTLSAPFGLTSRVLALLLWAAGAAMLVPAAAEATGKIVPTAVLATTALRFAVTGAYEWTASDGWRITAGIVGLALAALAAYAALAMALEDACHRTVLPVARRAAGRGAMSRGLDAQVAQIGHEAGVRNPL